MATILGATVAEAQDVPVTVAQADPAPRPSSSAERRPSDVSTFVGSLIPGFQANAGVFVSETYATNASGYSGSGNQDDLITAAGLNLDVHDHSRRVSLDASYSGQVYTYARGGQSTQFTNDLAALASVIAIPDYLNIIGRAFAQPVVISNSGYGTAGGIVGANGYRNSYGYTVGPDITFHLGDIAASETTATYGAAYFTDPAGVTNAGLIPGLAGPENITQRNITEVIKSGPDFTRLQWTVQGQFAETDRRQGLFSDKSAIATLVYRLTPEFALMGTGGYDKIHNSVRLSKDLSGPVGMGGVQVTFGQDFNFFAEVGQKYNSLSLLSSLRWNITATSSLTGSATDSVSTPEGQLLDSLSDLTATLNGSLVPSNDIYGNGSSASLAAFNAQTLGSLSFTQSISRYQRINFGYAFDFERDHASVQVFGDKQTQLDQVFIGPPVTNSYGLQAFYAHNISRLTTASLGAGYVLYQELGGHAKAVYVNGEVSYALGQHTGVYFRTDYYRRISSQGLQNLSPVTGSTDDIRLTVGLNHQF